MQNRTLGPADEVLAVAPRTDELARRFYEAVCVIAHPLSATPGQKVAIQMLNTMQSMCLARNMDDEQRTRFAEGMAAKVEEARRDG